MPALQGRRLWSKKQKPNPYADRGLVQFALVSAELQAARDRLIAELGTQLSVVRFTSGASEQSPWVPVIGTLPTSSKAEKRALRRAASDLVTGNFDAGDLGYHGGSFTGSLLEHLGGSIGKSNTERPVHDRSMHMGTSSCKVSIESSSTATQNDVGSNAIGRHDNQLGILGTLMMATEGILSVFKLLALGIKIIADIARKVILSKLYLDGFTLRTLPSWSTKGENVVFDPPCTDMACLSDSSSQVQPASISRRDTARTIPPLPLHVKAPKKHILSMFSSTPSSPRECQQLPKALALSVSLPKMAACSDGHALHCDNKENIQAQKKNPTKIVKSSALSVGRTTSTISSESLGQALSGAGLVVVLGGLVMGFVPAIVSIICWWYVLPRMRKTVGDKPFVRSHYHYHHGHTQEDKTKSPAKEEACSSRQATYVKKDVKKDVQGIEYKKKVIMDGLLERRHPHFHV